MDNIIIVRGEKYMIKIIGSLLLIIGSTGVGIFMSQKLSSRKKILEEFLKFILFSMVGYVFEMTCCAIIDRKHITVLAHACTKNNTKISSR